MTRITLDLAALLRDGRIDEAEAERLTAMAVTSRKLSIIANLLCIFGAVALAAGVIALKPDPSTGLVLALIALAIAGLVRMTAYEEWRVLSDGMAIAGTAGICGWLALEFGNTWHPQLINILILLIVTASTLAFKQPFIAAFIPIALGAILGSGTAYWHASYGLFVREPTITIVVFTILAFILYAGLKRIRASAFFSWQTVMLIPARASFFMVNFGFWVGTLWGDWPGEHFASKGEFNWETAKQWREAAFHIPDWLFSIGWAGFLVAGILFGLREHNRFITNTAIVFLCIHFYTQFYEFLGLNPGTLVVGGLLMLAAAVWLFRFDQKKFGAQQT